MEIKTIKGISPEIWMEFKALAARKNVALGVLFRIMLENYVKNSESFWKDILTNDKSLSDEEAEEMHKVVRNLRKDKGFRV